MSDLVINVKQIGNYPAKGASDGSETLLLQAGGLGGPYRTISAQNLVATALNGASIGVGEPIPADTNVGGVFATNLSVPSDGSLFWNAYWGADGLDRFWRSGLAAGFTWADSVGFFWSNWGVGQADAPLPPGDTAQMILDLAGALRLPHGTLTVARDPAAAMEVATANWVGNNTVARFNNRIGNVTLNQADIYQALCLDSAIATQGWVMASVNAAIGDLITSHPFVFCWNGRSGNVFLTLSDITTVFFQPGQQPITPTPAADSDDFSIANTAWVTAFLKDELEGAGGIIATQAWVLANTVNSFNGRLGQVTLTGADVFNVGAAPINSPNFAGVPTAPTAAPGASTAQLATTAFVQAAISQNTAGVSTFNTRSGDVVLQPSDIIGAAGITNPNATLTGTPSATTAAPGTNTVQIATCAFVQAALAAGAVTSFNTRTGAVTLTLLDITGVGGAPLVSPAFTSLPTAPTAAPGTNTTQLATCAFVTNAVTSAGGVSSFNSRTGAVTLTANDLSAAGGLVNPSVTLTGVPTAPTASANTNTQQIATCAFVEQALAGTVTSFNTRTGAIVLTGADITGAGGAVLASPAFTGVPTAPTATTGTNNTQLATTQFVNAEIAANTNTVQSFNSRTGAVTLITADITGAGGAVLNSPVFSGTPTAPTATAGTNTTQLATTQFVQSAIASSGVASFNGRTGAVTLIANDVSAVGGALLASPTFTGTPSAPTAAPGTNTTQLATTAYALAAAALRVLKAGDIMTGHLGFNVTPSTTPAPAWSSAPWAPQYVATGSAAPGMALNCYAGPGTGGQNIIAAGSAAMLTHTLSTGTLSIGVWPSGAAGAGIGTAANFFNITQTYCQCGVQGMSYASPANGSGITGSNPPMAFGWDSAISTSIGLSLGISGANQGWLVRTFTSSGAWNPVVAWAANPGLTSSTGWSYGSASFSWATTVSDRRLKFNVMNPDKDALGIVTDIPVQQCDYRRNGYEEHWDFTLMADQIRDQMPCAYIAPPDEAGFATLAPLHLISLLWRAVQQLTDRVQALEAA